MRNYYQISKKEFYGSGGFANTKLFRMMKGRYWAYYRYFY